MYQLKLLQLMDIKEYKNDLYLKLNVQFDKEETFYWKVDYKTAKSLQAITNFSKGYLYRLSFRTYLDKSIVTQTHLEQSLKLEFTCSENYVKQLMMLKQVDSLDKLDKLDFLSRKLEQRIKVPKIELVQAAQKETPRKRKSPWLVAAAITAIFAIIFSYTGHSIYTEALAQPDKNADDHELVMENIAPTKEMEEPKPGTIISEESISIEIPEIPFIELSDGTSSGVPEGKVALTFDDGPSLYTNEIINLLKENGAGGTFFLVGSNIDKFPGKTEYIYENGFSIGTHSMNHVNFASSSANEQKNELLESSDLIESIIGEEITLFRPPYGHMNNTTEQISAELGQRIVLWNNDPKDWESRDARKIINHIKSTEVSGAIILLHETKSTLEALPEIIAYLQEQNLELITLR